MGPVRRSLIVLALLFIADCATAPVVNDTLRGVKLTDGIFEGSFSSWPNDATVKVTVKEGMITDIQVLHHFGSWIGRKAVPVIPQRIIEKQSVNVDAVTGATNSSRVIMHAVQNALEKSSKKNEQMKE